MANIIIALFFNFPSKAITEVLNIQVDKCFEQFRKNQITVFFWKSMCILLILICLTTILFFNADWLLIYINIEDKLAQKLC